MVTTTLYADQEATVRTDMKKGTGFTLGEKCVKAVYCHPAYLTNIDKTPYAKHQAR